MLYRAIDFANMSNERITAELHGAKNKKLSKQNS